MNYTSIKCPWIVGDFSFQHDKNVQISVVTYEYTLGIPARFCAGLIPPIALSQQLKLLGTESVIRLIDPTSIANYCNGWDIKETRFKTVVCDFFEKMDVKSFFDESEQASAGMVSVLENIGLDLISSTDSMVIDMVSRISESGRKHGGELGASNAILYMAAHPFSWLNMHHPLIWRRQYSSDDYQFVNLMSKPESRFTVIRKFLQQRRPDLSTTNNPTDYCMTVCNTPCYIPIEDEPTFVDLTDLGYDWCHTRYKELKKRSENHRRALKDFESLLHFLKP